MNIEIRFIVAIAIHLAAIPFAFGQSAERAEVARETSRITRPTPSRVEAAPSEVAPSRQLADWLDYGRLQILHDTRLPPTFSLQAFGGAYYTTNAPLLPENEIGDWYFQQGLAFSWSRGVLDYSLFPRVLATNSWFEYSNSEKHGVEDFASTTFTVGATYVLKKLAYIGISIDYEYERLADLDLSDEFFHEHHLLLGLSKTFVFSRTQSLSLLGLADLSLNTEPTITERNDFGVSVSYAIDWTPEIATAFSYQYTRLEYTQGPRTDNKHSVSAALLYQVTDWASLQLNVYFVHNNSNFDVFDYEVLTSGLSVGFIARW